MMGTMPDETMTTGTFAAFDQSGGNNQQGASQNWGVVCEPMRKGKWFITTAMQMCTGLTILTEEFLETWIKLDVCNLANSANANWR